MLVDVHIGYMDPNISPLHALSTSKLMTTDCKRAYRESSTPYEACKTCMIDVHGAFAQVSQAFHFRETSPLSLKNPFYILY